jgi:hypothetical protein
MNSQSGIELTSWHFQLPWAFTYTLVSLILLTPRSTLVTYVPRALPLENCGFPPLDLKNRALPHTAYTVVLRIVMEPKTGTKVSHEHYASTSRAEEEIRFLRNAGTPLPRIHVVTFQNTENLPFTAIRTCNFCLNCRFTWRRISTFTYYLTHTDFSLQRVACTLSRYAISHWARYWHRIPVIRYCNHETCSFLS